MMNPVLRREMVTTLRGWRNYAVLTFYLLMMSLGAALFLYMSIFSQYSFDPQTMVYMYVVLSALQMGLVVLSVPALAAGSISGERERQTLDLLLVTKMSPLSIVIGKLLSSMAFILLLIVSALPVFSVVFYFGSIDVPALLTMMAFTLTTTFMLGGISVFFSCIYKRTVVSIMLVYIILGVLCFGTLLATMLPFMTVQEYEPNAWIVLLKLIPNPGVGFFSMMDGQLGMDIVGTMFFDMFSSLSSAQQWAASNLWMLHIVFQLVVGVIFILLAAWMINPVREHKLAKPRKEKQKKEKPAKKKKEEQ